MYSLLVNKFPTSSADKEAASRERRDGRPRASEVPVCGESFNYMQHMLISADGRLSAIKTHLTALEARLQAMDAHKDTQLSDLKVAHADGPLTLSQTGRWEGTPLTVCRMRRPFKLQLSPRVSPRKMSRSPP